MKSRRRILQRAGAALIGMPWLLTGARAQPAPLRLTPRQTEGPFYPLQLPADSDADLLRNGARSYARGQPLDLLGSVRDLDGRPVRGARVEIWQCDAGGHYHHPGDGNRADADFQGFGATLVDADGAYRFRTLRPVAYGGRTPHIHVKVRLGQRTLLTTQMYVQGEPGNERDFLVRSLSDPADRLALLRPLQAQPDGLWRGEFPIVVAAA